MADRVPPRLCVLGGDGRRGNPPTIRLRVTDDETRFAERPILGRRSEELQGQVVWIAEGQTGAVRSIDDAAVRYPEVVQPLLPALEVLTARNGEGDVVQ